MGIKIITEGQFITVPFGRIKHWDSRTHRSLAQFNSTRLCLTEQALGPTRKWLVVPIVVLLLPSQLSWPLIGFTAE